MIDTLQFAPYYILYFLWLRGKLFRLYIFPARFAERFDFEMYAIRLYFLVARNARKLAMANKMPITIIPNT